MTYATLWFKAIGINMSSGVQFNSTTFSFLFNHWLMPRIPLLRFNYHLFLWTDVNTPSHQGQVILLHLCSNISTFQLILCQHLLQKYSIDMNISDHHDATPLKSPLYAFEPGDDVFKYCFIYSILPELISMLYLYFIAYSIQSCS